MGKSYKENKWKKNFGKDKNTKNKKPFHNHQKENDVHGQEDFDSHGRITLLTNLVTQSH